MNKQKVSTLDIVKKKGEKQKIAAVTVYDYPFASLLDQTGADIFLVGDSVGTTVLGYDNTLPVTMEDMIRHTAAVKRGTKRALVATDLPFMSYQVSIDSAIENAGRLVKEGGAEAVKLEGGEEMLDTIAAIVEIGIPVIGHVGLTPQYIHKLGGYKVQGKKNSEAKRIVEDARAVEEAGAFCIVLEGIPMEVAKEITNRLSIPTIGIGAGAHCDGQIMVLHDLLGLSGDFKPKFVKQYAQLGEVIKGAIGNYVDEVKKGQFPDEGFSYRMEKSHLRPVGKSEIE